MPIDARVGLAHLQLQSVHPSLEELASLAQFFDVVVRKVDEIAGVVSQACEFLM